jgi:hypothetical protein
MNHTPLRLVPRFVLAIAAAALLTSACGSLQGNALAGVSGGSPTQAKTHDSTVFGFAVDIPANWRKSDVLSTVIAGDPVFLGHEVFTSRTVSEEDTLLPQQLTAAAWATSIHAGAREGQVIDSLTFAGQSAVRITGGARFPVQYFISYKGVMYLVAYNTHRETASGVDENTLKAIVASFRFTR